MAKIKSKTKILYLVTQSQWGGAQKYIYDLVNNLDDKKYVIEVGVGKPGKADWLEALEGRGFKVHRLKHVVREVNLWHDFLSGIELYRLFLGCKPDIVHLNSSKIGSTGAVVAWIYKKLYNRRLKIVYTVHGFVFNEPLSFLMRKFYLWSERISGLFKDKLICVSEHDKIIGLNFHVADHRKFVTVHNGIDLDKLSFLDKKEARQKLISQCKYHGACPNNLNNFWIGTVANLYSTKGLEYFIRSAKILADKYDNLSFLVIGEGALRKNLEEKIDKLNLKDCFCLLGSLPRAFQYLKAFDVFALSSVKEGFPYTLIEALAAGSPVVATQVGGVMEIIEPEINGLIVEPAKPAEFAKALEKLITNEKLRQRFAKNNIKKSEKFSLEKMVERTERVYEEL